MEVAWCGLFKFRVDRNKMKLTKPVLVSVFIVPTITNSRLVSIKSSFHELHIKYSGSTCCHCLSDAHPAYCSPPS